MESRYSSVDRGARWGGIDTINQDFGTNDIPGIFPALSPSQRGKWNSTWFGLGALENIRAVSLALAATYTKQTQSSAQAMLY